MSADGAFDTEVANRAAVTSPRPPVTVCCAPNLAFISAISLPLAQCRLIAPPAAPAATPHTALNIVAMDIMGRNQTAGNSGAATSRVMPISTAMSANNLHRLMSERNFDAATEVKRRVASIPHPSRKIKFNDALSAVAPSFPTPTPSSTRCVARTALIWVVRSCAQLHMEYARYPGGVWLG